MSTKTGSVTTRQPIEDLIMTRPLNPRSLSISDDRANSCKVSWLPPEHHHSCLKSYRVQVRTSDNRIINDVAVLKSAKTFLIRNLQQCTDYDVDVTAVCIKNSMRTESEPLSVKFTTLPETIRNLKMEHATPNSITVKWDIPVVTSGVKYILAISGKTNEKETNDDNDEDMENIENFEMVNIEVAGDKNQFTFSKLPDIIGSGHAFKVSIVTVYASPREIETTSEECQEIFMTKPIPPTHLDIGSTNEPFQICWHKSMTPNVTKYRIRWKSRNSDDIKTEEEIIESQTEDEIVYFQFPFESIEDNTEYKVNVYAIAIATCGDLEAESKELHEKFFFTKDPPKISVLTDNE